MDPGPCFVYVPNFNLLSLEDRRFFFDVLSFYKVLNGFVI